MGTFVLTDEEISSDEYKETGVYVSDVDWDSDPVEGVVIGTPQSEKYECGDRIVFDPSTLVEV